MGKIRQAQYYQYDVVNNFYTKKKKPEIKCSQVFL